MSKNRRSSSCHHSIFQKASTEEPPHLEYSPKPEDKDKELIAKSDTAELDFDPFEDAVLSRQGEIRLGYPSKPEEDIEVLGLTLDCHMQWGEHFAGLMSEAQVRQGILKKISSSAWGLEVSLL